MNIGYRIIKDFERADKNLIEKFRNIAIPNLGDCMNRTSAVASYIQAFNKARVLGSAYTVRVPAGDNLMFYYAIEEAQPGDVIVVDGGGFTERALCGEIMAAYAKKKGLAGFVIDGAVRDKIELAEMDFPVFAKSCSPNGPYKNGPGEVNVPVTIGGRVIQPGDIIVGDENGLVVFHPREAAELLDKVQRVIDKEAAMMRSISEDGCLDLRWVYEKIKQDACTIED